jgi:eukaryotic-like serine/threonine-protein kinase
MQGTAPAPDLTDRWLEEPDVSRNSKTHSLTPELMAEASWRLGWLGLVYAAGSIATYFGRRLLLALVGFADWRFHVSDVFGFMAVAMGVAVYVACRRGWLSPTRLLDLGLVFQVAGAFGLAAKEFWDGVPPTAGYSFLFVPRECVWIVAYPLVVPNTPSKVLVASLLAASMGPAALALSPIVSGTTIDRPAVFALYFLTSNYLCAVTAYVVARIVYRFNVRLKHARDIGSYELIERLGKGGMGEVWRAKHRLLARPAAIKLIRRDVLGANERTRDALVRRFEREAHDTATLESVHTIRVYDFGITEEADFYYAMELLNGLSLERLVQVFGPMEPARVVHLLRQVCHSLREAHAHGLVHRDIKPANIFVCRLGPDDDFVKVLDFGIVKHVEGSATLTKLTMGGGALGTPAYMAPEIALGHFNVDARADIYSLGCVAYYMLTGQLVFSAETPVGMALAHVHEQPVPPSERSEFQIPVALEATILECLAKDPDARPASAAVLEQRLAGTVPSDAWTAGVAHAWWECHQPDLTCRRSGTARGPVTHGQAPSSGERPRFRPRRDRKLIVSLPRIQFAGGIDGSEM